MTNKKWLIGNWKMHGSLDANENLIGGIRSKLPLLDSRIGMVVCPSFPYLQQVFGLIEESDIALGAQNLSEQAKGAYTGEVCGDMIKDIGAKFVIIGHSERRSYQAEDDELIARKVHAALGAGLLPVLCIGETKFERENNQTKDVLSRQLDTVLSKIDPAKDEILIAYEPRWAIGTGVSATPEMIEEVHGFLRDFLITANADFGKKTPLLYGGSMNASNAVNIAGIRNVDGGLIGSAALKADEFVAIYQALLETVENHPRTH